MRVARTWAFNDYMPAGVAPTGQLEYDSVQMQVSYSCVGPP